MFSITMFDLYDLFKDTIYGGKLTEDNKVTIDIAVHLMMIRHDFQITHLINMVFCLEYCTDNLFNYLLIFQYDVLGFDED